MSQQKEEGAHNFESRKTEDSLSFSPILILASSSSGQVRREPVFLGISLLHYRQASNILFYDLSIDLYPRNT